MVDGIEWRPRRDNSDPHVLVITARSQEELDCKVAAVRQYMNMRLDRNDADHIGIYVMASDLATSME